MILLPEWWMRWSGGVGSIAKTGVDIKCPLLNDHKWSQDPCENYGSWIVSSLMTIASVVWCNTVSRGGGVFSNSLIIVIGGHLMVYIVSVTHRHCIWFIIPLLSVRYRLIHQQMHIYINEQRWIFGTKT